MSSALSQLDTASTWSPLRRLWANTAPGDAATTRSLLRDEQVGEAVDGAGARLRLEDPEDGHVALLVGQPRTVIHHGRGPRGAPQVEPSGRAEH